MATYKVLQDIEAEDKLIGPLTLRQFIYAGIAVLCGYLAFLLASKGAAFLSVIFLPPLVLCGFFAWPWSKDQPTEVWALAKIRYLVKPRKRLWDQTGIKELVTITAPKKVDQNYSNGLSEHEVRSRLHALADTIDSRGWAIKNVNVNLYSQPSLVMNDPSSDRLISLSSLPQAVPQFDVQASDDMLDEQNNPLAAQVESRLQASDRARRQRAIHEMEQPSPPAPAKVAAPAPAANNYWFLNQPSQAAASVPQDAVTFNTQVVTPTQAGPLPQTQNPSPATATATSDADEQALLKELEEKEKAQQNVSTYGHLHTIQPLSAQPPQPSAPTANPPSPKPAVPAQPKPAILDLANNDDLNVATIAREANKRREISGDEVVISLH